MHFAKGLRRTEKDPAPLLDGWGARATAEAVRDGEKSARRTALGFWMALLNSLPWPVQAG